MFGDVEINVYFCHMKKNIFIAIVALLASFTLQVIWVVNSYEETTNRISKDIDDMFMNAMFDEVESRSNGIPNGTEIEYPEDFGDDNSYFTNYQVLNDGLLKLIHKDINIDTLAGYIDKRKAEDFDYDYILVYKNSTSKIVYKSKHQPKLVLASVKSRIIPTRWKHSEYIQLELLNPYDLFFKEMGLVVISSFIILLLLIGCIVKQLSIIRIQRKTMQMRRDFTYAMVHDMKTPISTITLGANALGHEKIVGNAEMRGKYIRIMKDEAQHLLALVNKILTISKLEEGKLEMSKEDVELAPMVEGIEEKFAANTEKEIRFTNSLSADTVFADAEYLAEALSNLIDNAVKYSRKDVTTEIEISSRDTGNGVEIKVRDNGMGISKKDQKIIFDKFERASALGRTFKNNGPAGFGLGLSYVMQVIEAHGGIVGVVSEVGRYTEFTILLPYEKEDEETA